MSSGDFCDFGSGASILFATTAQSASLAQADFQNRFGDCYKRQVTTGR